MSHTKSDVSKTPGVVTLISIVNPESEYATRAEVTHARNTPRTVTVVSSILNTSRVNSAPPAGALKIPAIPAPAPQPTRIMSMRGETLKNDPIRLPMPAPAYAIGPSEPADPPNPSVRALAIIDP